MGTNYKESNEFWRESPHFWLRKYKTTERPRPCERCSQNAYYYHDDFGYLCATHLLDLINIGEVLWKWTDYPEIWQRTEILLKRPKPSGTAKNMVVEHLSPAKKQRK
mgnify:CR=1 FL=1